MSSTTKILVVDDEPVGRQLLEAILVPEGYDLTFGVDGEEAVKTAISELPDIILLDVMMPKMDGFEVCKKLRENQSTAHIPIYLITALDDRDSRIKGIDAGAYDYISKPFDRVEVLAKIKNLTNQLKILKKGGSVKEELLKVAQIPTSKSNLPTLLAQIILDSEPDSDQYQVYRSISVDESAHACIRKKTNLGQYTLLLSSKLIGDDAVLSNCIFRSILYKNIEEYDGQLKKIIHQSYQDLNKLIERNKKVILKSQDLSVIIILQHNESNNLTVTGLNQHIFMLENNPLINQSQNPAYHTYFLQGNQELKYEDVKGIIAFSTSVYEKMNPQELLGILNDTIKNANDINIETLNKAKLGSVSDILIVKLSF